MFAALALALAAPVPPATPAGPQPILVSVAVPAVHGQRELPLTGTFPVVVVNTSDKPVRLWRDWCSWGYFTLSLEFRDDGGRNVAKEWAVTKADRSWRKNYPDAAELAPGESIIFTVTLKPEEWKEMGFLAEYAGKKLKMRVRYDVVPDADSEKMKVWTGSVRTAWQEYAVGR